MRGGASVNALTSDRLGDIGPGPTFCDTLVEAAPSPLVGPGGERAERH